MSRTGRRPDSGPAVPRPTVRDVAARAGVGVGTVSRYLNASPALGAAAHAAVERAVDELGYRPDPAGRALRRGSSGTVGVLVPTLANPIFALSLDGIESGLREAGQAVIVATSGYDRVREREAIETLRDRGVDALIATLCDPLAGGRAPLEASGLPHVLLYNEVPADGSPAPPTVTVDNRGAVRDVTRRLVDAGHVHIAFLGGRFAASDRSRARHAGYRDAMAAAGLPSWRPVELPFDADGRVFEAAVAELLERLRRPTALVCSNDLLALQSVRAARRLGLDVPGELSVVGFDGMPMAALAEPPLTTIRQPAREMGHAAAALLLGRLRGRAGGSANGPVSGGPASGPANDAFVPPLVLADEFVPGGTFDVAAGTGRRRPTSASS